MASKTQPTIPPPVHLETIYEESGSSLSSSIVDITHQSRNRQKSSTYSKNQSIHGLISARSIPSVDAHRRRRTNEYQQKPPVEVRHRDGTKHYIHPSLTTTTSMTVSRRKYSHSSRHDSSLSPKTNTKYRQIFNTTPKKTKKLSKKPEVILTIITNEDLSQANITPPSTSSPDETDTLALMKSLSNSSLDTITTIKDISIKSTDEASIEELPIVTVLPSIEPVKPVINIPILNLRLPVAPRHRSEHQSQSRYPQQINTIRSQSLPPSQSHVLSSTHQKSISNQIPPVAVVPPSPKKPHPSLQITLTDDENKRNLSSKTNLLKTMTTTTTSSSKSTKEKIKNEHKQYFQPSATILVGGGSRSAFRPFLKPIIHNSQPQIPFNFDVKSQIPTKKIIHKSSQPRQQQIIPPSHPHVQPYQPSSSSSTATYFTSQPSSKLNPAIHTRRSISSDASNKQSITSIKSNQILSDTVINSTSQIKSSNYSQQSIPLLPTINNIDNSLNKSNISQDQIKDIDNNIVAIDPNLQWHTVTSKSLYDVPRLSYKYSDIPLRITLPEGTPTHNQKLLHKHDIELEKRLLDAGLSPETVALYERILEVADIHQMTKLSPPEIMNQF